MFSAFEKKDRYVVARASLFFQGSRDGTSPLTARKLRRSQ
jgi:hypothetical protein